jgi:RNA polymerase sigma-70 factor, ECF subfamily
MNNAELLTDEQILEQIKADNVKAFEILFHRYYEKLCRYAFRFVNRWEVLEELVSGLFSHLWEKRNTLLITVSLKSYLYAAARHSSLNYLKSQFAKHPFQLQADENQFPPVSSPAEEITFQELQTIIEQGIDTLSERCRIIFTLSRNTGLSYTRLAVG